MRICLVGHFSNPFDNKGDLGTKNLGRCIAGELSKRHEVINLDIYEVGWWKKIRFNRLQLIHFVLDPTTMGLAVIHFFKFLYRNAKVVVSAPNLHLSFKRPLAFFGLKPDIVLAQSLESERMLIKMGYQVRVLPNGVDIERFQPLSEDEKRNIRNKYGIPDWKSVFLHVGPLIAKRNIIFLRNLQGEDTQVVIVGRTPANEELYKTLRNAGCRIWTKYFPNIEEVYAMSDCYVFPTVDGVGAIELPLSVLEAMACNLPVITTRFGAIPRFFDEGDGLMFVNGEENFQKAVRLVQDGGLKIKTREKVLPYSWENIAKKLEQIYQELVREVEVFTH